MISKEPWRVSIIGGGLCLLLCGGCRRHEIAAPPPIAVQVVALKREPISSETRFGATVREQAADFVVVQGARHRDCLVAGGKRRRQAARGP